jgi:hypothetical protein
MIHTTGLALGGGGSDERVYGGAFGRTDAVVVTLDRTAASRAASPAGSAATSGERSVAGDGAGATTIIGDGWAAAGEG